MHDKLLWLYVFFKFKKKTDWYFVNYKYQNVPIKIQLQY